MSRGESSFWPKALLWLVAIAVAMMFDKTVATKVHELGLDAWLESHKLVRSALKLPGLYGFTIAIAVIVWLGHSMRWRATIFLLVGTAMSGINFLIKWIAGRARPFKTLTGNGPVALNPFNLHPFPGGLQGLFSGRNLCFPSGHAALAFATAAALSILLPRWRWGFYLLAMLVAAERVAENAHWLSDAVAAAALGVGCVAVARRMLWDKRRPVVGARKSEHGSNPAVPISGDPGV
ncbi:MAG TPA: phosphatase PAP2 family protein [Tepidisphaeraceae bacterium]|jgi:membrane-associated phospholipid phosphatase